MPRSAREVLPVPGGPIKKEIVAGSLRFQNNPRKIIRSGRNTSIQRSIELGRALPQQQITPSLSGRKESGKSQIHATKGGVHIVVLYGIKASSRQYTRILLSGTKTDTDLVIGYALYITFKHHLVGNVVGIRIPFVKNHRITPDGNWAEPAPAGKQPFASF